MPDCLVAAPARARGTVVAVQGAVVDVHFKGLAGINTRRVKRALAALFGGAMGKDIVSRTWRKIRTDWDVWTRRELAGEEIVRLILDGWQLRTCRA